ncbi:hypothetical protein GCM10010343_24980 [Streptomyces avidinii]|nr:hypothetical protein GCM10010343_24980 [Streptomyces avidinii]
MAAGEEREALAGLGLGRAGGRAESMAGATLWAACSSFGLPSIAPSIMSIPSREEGKGVG